MSTANHTTDPAAQAGLQALYDGFDFLRGLVIGLLPEGRRAGLLGLLEKAMDDTVDLMHPED